MWWFVRNSDDAMKEEKQKKIVYVMESCFDINGIPSFQYFIPKELHIKFDILENILLIGNDKGEAIQKVQKEGLTARISKNIVSMIYNIIRLKPKTVVVFHRLGLPQRALLILIAKIFSMKVVRVLDLSIDNLPKFKKIPVLKLPIEVIKHISIYLQLLLADEIVCWTKYEIDILPKSMKVDKGKFHIIPIGHNFQIGTPPAKKNHIITVSKLWSPRKNLDTIVDVFGRVVRERECKLIVVGNFLEGKYKTSDGYEIGERYRRRVMDIIKEKNMGDYIEFVGTKSSEELQGLYRESRIFYLPSKLETFGMVFVEAMASGLPIVAMPNSAVKYVVRDGITGFLREDPEEQKEAILKLLSDEKLYKKMQENCLKEAENYRWENIIEKWHEII